MSLGGGFENHPPAPKKSNIESNVSLSLGKVTVYLSDNQGLCITNNNALIVWLYSKIQSREDAPPPT